MKLLRTLLLAGLVAGSMQSAYAVPMLRLSDGITTVTIADNGAGDINPLAGMVTFSGGIGNFIANVSTGTTKPLIGSEGSPYLKLTSVDISGWGGGALTISFTDTDFTGPTGPSSAFHSSIGGVSDGSVSFNTYADASNAAFGTGTGLSDLDFINNLAGAAFAGSNTAFVDVPTSPFSITLVAQITHGWYGFKSTSLNGAVNVPEPGMLGLLGGGLIALTIARRRKAA